VEGSKNLLNACVKQNVKNIIAASSAAVYGIPSDLPLTESSSTLPLSPYGESKLEMEKLISDFSQKHNLNSISLRFFNIFGKGQTDAYAGVITKFMKNIREDKSLVIFGDGSNTRDFIFIEDVVNSIKNAIEKLEGKKGKHYNIATGSFISIKELANLMIAISGKKLDIVFSPPKEGDISHSQASIQLPKQELDFFPKTPLKEGLKRIL
jgi:UDP-glucose 4-epimerase